MVADDGRRPALPGVVGGGTLVGRHARARGTGPRTSLLVGGHSAIGGAAGAVRRSSTRWSSRATRLARAERQRRSAVARRSSCRPLRRSGPSTLDGLRHSENATWTSRSEPVEADVAGRRPADRHGHGEQAPARARIAADLEDIGAVAAELEVDRNLGRARTVVHDPQPLLRPVGADQPLAADADRPADELVERMDLGVRVPVRARDWSAGSRRGSCRRPRSGAGPAVRRRRAGPNTTGGGCRPDTGRAARVGWMSPNESVSR